MVSAMKCVSLMIHRPVPLGQIIHYMLIKIVKKQNKTKTIVKEGHSEMTFLSNNLNEVGQADKLLSLKCVYCARVSSRVGRGGGAMWLKQNMSRKVSQDEVGEAVSYHYIMKGLSHFLT